MATVIDVDPSGDVLLACRPGCEEVQRLRVWSVALSLGSSVFKAMFSTRFKEGIELAASSDVVIPLPDDPPHAMDILCSVLHHRNNAVPQGPDLEAEEMARIAELSDKYDCTEALKPSIRSWLLPHKDTASVEQRRHLMTAAYYFHDDRAFRDYGRWIVIHSQTPVWNPAIDDASHPLCVVFQLLEVERLRLHRNVMELCEEEIESRSDKTFAKGQCMQGCSFTKQYAAHFLEQLRTAHLWPPKKIFSVPLVHLFKAMRQVEEDKAWAACTPCAGNRCVRDELQHGTYTANTFRYKATSLEKDARVPCVSCFREEGGPKREGCDHVQGNG